MTGTMAAITVARTDTSDIGHREIFIAVDGKTIGILKHGETVTHELPAGPHRIRAHNTLFWKNIEIDLRPGERARFRAVNRPGWGTYSVLAWIGAGPLYLTFEREPAD
jgi:hypothetical protein